MKRCVSMCKIIIKLHHTFTIFFFKMKKYICIFINERDINKTQQ